MKCCNRCKINKPFEQFRKDIRYKSGYGSWCKDCHKERNSSWFQENKAHHTKKSYAWRESNIEKARHINKAFKFRNKKKLAEKHADWAKDNRGKRNATMAKRKAKKLMATPTWADMERIARIYKQAAVWQLITGQRLHVDHVIPLQGETVCGLHCHTNLRIVEGRINESKRNNIPDLFVEPPKKPEQTGFDV